MGNWRPDDWKNPHHVDWIPDYHNAEFQDVETGADMMLEALRKKGLHVINNAFVSNLEDTISAQNIHGTYVFIPDDEEVKKDD